MRIGPPRPILRFLLHVQAAEPMHSEGQRDLSAVVDVVLGDVPDDVSPAAPGPAFSRVPSRTLELCDQVSLGPLVEAGRELGP